MKIVHQIDYPCAVVVSGSGEPYLKRNDEAISHSFPIDVLICADDPQEEAIYIEGNALFILKALEKTVAMIKDTGATLVQEGKLSSDWDKMEAYEERNDKLKEELEELNFYQLYISGKIEKEQIGDYVKYWYTGEKGKKGLILSDYLGLTQFLYEKLIETPKEFWVILDDERAKRNK